MNFDDLIFEKSNVLSKELCDDIINRYDNDKRKQQGITNDGEVHLDIKNCLDLSISYISDWDDVTDIIRESTQQGFEEYRKNLYDFIKHLDPIPKIWGLGIRDRGYNLKRYDPDNYFNWHVDSYVTEDNWTRSVAAIWYLNDDFDEGETEFVSGRKIKPGVGKLLMFPSIWVYPHRGVAPKNGSKYIITSFIYTKDIIPGDKKSKKRVKRGFGN